MALEYINYAFVGLFTIEIILRMIASGLGYFLVPWNMFDFLVIVGSLISNHNKMCKRIFLIVFFSTQQIWSQS